MLVHERWAAARRWVAAAAVGALTTAGLVVGLTAPAMAAPVASMSAQIPGQVLGGAPIPVTLNISKSSTTDDAYNLSYSIPLAPGVSYVPGSAQVLQGRELVAAPDPQVIAIMSVTDPLVVDHYVLVWQNVSDLPANATAQLAFELEPDPAVYPVGATVVPTEAWSAYASSDPRHLPKFNGATGAVQPEPGTDVSAQTAPGSTQISAIRVTKSEPSSESELMRGVHDQTVIYSVTVTVTEAGSVTDTVVVDWLPANLEFLGCGNVDHSSAPEYPGAPPLGLNPVPGCSEPLSVETVTVTGGDPNGPAAPGVYTKVTWNIGPLAAGASTTLQYRAGVPLFANTATWPGATPATTGAQGSNLDNNTGPSTRQGAGSDTENATNLAVATALYEGPLAPGGDPTQTARDTETVEVRDLAMAKELVSPDSFRAGQIATFELTLRTSEYVTASGIAIVDEFPDGMCPIVPAGWTGTYPAAAPPECAATVATEPTNAAITAVTWGVGAAGPTITVVPDGVPTGSAAGEVPTNDLTVIRYQALMLDDYSTTSYPTVAGASFANSVDVTATTTDLDGVETAGVTDDSEATIGTHSPSITKQVATRQGGGVVDCPTLPASAWHTTGPNPVYQLDDRVCFRLTIELSDSAATRNATVQDFVPSTLDWASTDWAHTSSTGAPVTLVSSSGSAPIFHIGTPVGLNWYAPIGTTVEIFLWGRVNGTEPTATVDLNANLMKFRQIDSTGRVTSIRDDADFGVLPPALALDKQLVGATPSTPVRAGDVRDFRIDITNTTSAGNFSAEQIVVWDALPPGFTCADVTTLPPSHSAQCVTVPSTLAGWVGPADTEAVLVWTVTGPLAAGASVTPAITYSVTIPTGLGVDLTHTNTASVAQFESATTTGTPAMYYPGTPLRDPAAYVPNTPSATDEVTLTTANTTFAKTATPTAITDSGLTGNQVVAGQSITYTYTATVPRGLAVFNGVLSDPLPSGAQVVPATTVSATVGSFTQSGPGTFANPDGPGDFTLAADGTLTFPADYTASAAADQTISVTLINLRINPTAVQPNTVTNTATLASTATPTGSVRSMDASATLSVRSPQLALGKTAAPTTGVASDVHVDRQQPGDGRGSRPRDHGLRPAGAELARLRQRARRGHHGHARRGDRHQWVRRGNDSAQLAMVVVVGAHVIDTAGAAPGDLHGRGEHALGSRHRDPEHRERRRLDAARRCQRHHE